MQQTDKYKLNLIETSDAFSPEALNENARKVEAALSLKTDAADADAIRAGLEAADAALDQRVQVLEGHKVVAGTYVGNGDKNGMHVELGFTPAALLVPGSNSFLLMITPDRPYSPYPLTVTLKIESGGFFAADTWNGSSDYPFIAIL